LIAFSPSIYFGDTELSREELEELLAQDSDLAFFKGKWVEVSRERIEQVLSALNKIEARGSLTLADALRLKAGLDDNSEDEAEVQTGIDNCQWLEQLIGKMRDPQRLAAAPLSGDFRAELRNYQQAGLNWLELMRGYGFGALLADDMGLGKTVQVLALLDSLRERHGSIRALIVVPASLLANWQKEAQRFAPKLRVHVVHGPGAKYDQSQAEMFITTYGMVARLEQLSADAWDMLILDEAQAIKNPAIKQTKAIKNLKASVRLAMTGTPIENRLADLWSIFDFLNTGLLGRAKEFKSFAAKLKDSPSGYARLRNILAPFILRRLKTDKAVISDLPEKNEIIRYTTLSKRQVALYSALVKELEELFGEADPDPATASSAPSAPVAPASSDGIARKGRILAAIMKFKQICNHPDQYIGQGVFDPRQSGKFDALAEICETIKSKHESVLVFTQFRELCEPLANYLQGVFGRPGLMIHGGMTPKQRGNVVERFNREYLPFMVLSLKAGGVGLNLTAANHVIHFDRWWNPAIENQATDRAFRIGQTKDVMVHKFVTTGTIEEKIDAIIASKQQLANDVIAPTSGESWVTELSNSELLDLFRLEV
jgi:non-specific serine/threonine protein kinase